MLIFHYFTTFWKSWNVCLPVLLLHKNSIILETKPTSSVFEFCNISSKFCSIFITKLRCLAIFGPFLPPASVDDAQIHEFSRVLFCLLVSETVFAT